VNSEPSPVSARYKVITLEQALARPKNEALLAFARHVNPVGAKLLRLGNFGKHYTRAEGTFHSFMSSTYVYRKPRSGHNGDEARQGRYVA
jgi:hypothetical protein